MTDKKPYDILGPWDHKERKCPCGHFCEEQHRWFELVNHFEGDHQAARAYVAQRLREAAYIVEKQAWPGLVGCLVPDVDKEIAVSNPFGEKVGVYLTYPWPG